MLICYKSQSNPTLRLYPLRLFVRFLRADKPLFCLFYPSARKSRSFLRDYLSLRKRLRRRHTLRSLSKPVSGISLRFRHISFLFGRIAADGNNFVAVKLHGNFTSFRTFDARQFFFHISPLDFNRYRFRNHAEFIRAQFYPLHFTGYNNGLFE